MPPKPTGWNRIVARLRGEIPAAALEAYRRASGAVFELFEQVERGRLEAAIDGLDPWSVPPAKRTAFLCAWNAFVLQTLGNEILDADYRGDPPTYGHVPPATARQVRAFYEPVEGWVNRAYQAQANPDYRLDLAVPARLPAWEGGETAAPAQLQGLLHALRTLLGHADAAMTSLPETIADAPDRQAQLNRIRQLHAGARARARYAEELAGVDPVPEVLAKAGAHARDAVEQVSLLGQLVADPGLAEAPAPAALPPARDVPRLMGLRGDRPSASGALGKRWTWFVKVALDTTAALPHRTLAVAQACWSGTPIGELVVLYDRLETRALRERLLFGLGVRKEVQAVEMLARVAREDPDPALRRTALYWLRVSRHERAPALVEQLTAGPGRTPRGE